MAKSKEKIMEIVFLLAACVSILAVALICVFLFANGIPAMKKIGFADFFLVLHGNREMIFMVFSHDSWKYLCYSRSHYHWCSDWITYRCFSGMVLPEKYIRCKTGSRAFSRYSICSIWFLWYGNDRASNPLQLWWNRKQYFSSFDSFRDYDSPNNYRCI